VHPPAEVYAASLSINIHEMADREHDSDSTGSPRTGARSNDQRNSLGERLRWCHPPERLSRSVVEGTGDGIELVLPIIGS
jgi:hypothetical protein